MSARSDAPPVTSLWSLACLGMEIHQQCNKFNPSPATEAMKLGLQYEPILASGYETLLKVMISFKRVTTLN